jgi:hypothetical protein
VVWLGGGEPRQQCGSARRRCLALGSVVPRTMTSGSSSPLVLVRGPRRPAVVAVAVAAATAMAVADQAPPCQATPQTTTTTRRCSQRQPQRWRRRRRCRPAHRRRRRLHQRQRQRQHQHQRQSHFRHLTAMVVQVAVVVGSLVMQAVALLLARMVLARRRQRSPWQTYSTQCPQSLPHRLKMFPETAAAAAEAASVAALIRQPHRPSTTSKPRATNPTRRYSSASRSPLLSLSHPRRR